ncbi:hypothetical protein DMI72_00345 [Akkermansia muciniphila]|jgi:hypothetical protein|nr:hypothetical protein CXT88_02785 [Akkermansia muciniphila]QHV52426.1 hypothetical protein DMI71_00345 [Akkermansia muciniphila]QHV54792.1 hypothetical protein DMI72_00345 [Akkermansia muciniphila]QHV60532.1 hypothetical protein DMI74_06055 [Akkermansia muciniphila]
MMMRDNGTRKNFPPQEKTVLLHQAVATRGKTREKTSKRNFPAFSSLFRKISPLLMEYSGTVITPSPGSSRDRPAQPHPCRKRHVDGISCQGQSSRTEILAGLDARGAAFSLLDQKFTVTLKNKKGPCRIPEKSASSHFRRQI